jgi:hypothetical protein
MKPGTKRTCWPLAALCLAGCSASELGPEPRDDSTEDVGSLESALGTAAPRRGCEEAVAGGDWTNGFLPYSTSEFTLTFRAWPYGQDENGHPLIDGVVGLSNGPGSRFTDLGPIVRFNPNGSIDARDGGSYVGSFPYKTSEPFEVQMQVNIPSHRYTVWVRHSDAIGKPFELLGSNLAFRSEQSALTQLDNAAVFIDSSSGELQACGFNYQGPDVCTVSRTTWMSRAFPRRSGHFQVEFDALPASADGSGTLDAVIGTASGAPTAFSQLAAIVRFRPDGTLDARNGASYTADRTLHYADTTSYHITMDIDAARGRYSVYVKDPTTDPELPPTQLANDYAFRAEQAGATWFDHLGQFVDGTPGNLYVCSLTVIY